MKNPNEDLVEQIEKLVREHLEVTRQATASAVERAFSLSSATPVARKESGPTRRSSSVRRSAAELSSLGERLHEVVCAHPGETMSVLAPKLSKTPRELSRPMAALKDAGRVRSAGQRHLTRYFPTVARAVASAS